MSGKRKLAQFAEIKSFPNVIEVDFAEAYNKKYNTSGTWSEEIFKNNNPIVLELGCGKGEYTIGMARKYPHVNFIGVDIKGARIWKGSKTALDEDLKNVRFLRSRIEVIDSFFDKNEVAEIWITFPDPQPRESREKKRLTSPQFIEKYRRILQENGIIHLKTDANALYHYSHEVAEQLNLDIHISTDKLYADLEKLDLTETEKSILKIPTFYEEKFLKEGHIICYLKYRI